MQSILDYFVTLGVSKDVAFSTSITISIFVVGFVLNRIYDRLRERKRLRSIRVFVTVYLGSLYVPIHNLSIRFAELAKQLRSESFSSFEYQEDNIRADYLRTFPQVDLFNALVRGWGVRRHERAQNFNAILEAVDYLERLRPIVKKEFDNRLDAYRKHLQEWNKSTDSILRQFDVIISEAQRNDIPPLAGSFVGELNQVVITFQQRTDQSILSVVHDCLVLKVREVCRRFPAEPRSVPLISSTLKASSALKNRNRILEMGARFYDEEGNKLARSYDIIRNAIQALQ